VIQQATGTIVRIRKPNTWEVVLEVEAIYGDSGSVARRMRTSGYDARAVRGEVIVNVRPIDGR
jgi:hypothetical protein